MCEMRTRANVRDENELGWMGAEQRWMEEDFSRT